ncbi:MAG TPA: hypothetical protein ENI62_12580 [Gammaproteobacteria bacterium]|nr:hypothetical protein [Gammaproteobacteria bacterium]
MRYIIQYTLPYEHRVMVGIEAESRDAAIAKASDLFDQGDIWQDSEEAPLLCDDFEETGDAGIPLEFTVESEVAGDWPKSDASVTYIRRREAAFLSARLLIEAYHRGEEHAGSIDWDDLDQAYQAALRASGVDVDQKSIKSAKQCAQLVVVLEGGIVQAMIADQPDAAPAVAVADYDTDGYESEELCRITQSDGSQSMALVVEHYVEPTRINLDEIFQKSD